VMRMHLLDNQAIQMANRMETVTPQEITNE
jgi:hypothetical protein